MTIGLAIVFAFILPNSHSKVLGMNEQELEWVRWNFEKDLGQKDDSSEISALKGFMMAVTDLKTWLLMGTLYSVSPHAHPSTALANLSRFTLLAP